MVMQKSADMKFKKLFSIVICVFIVILLYSLWDGHISKCSEKKWQCLKTAMSNNKELQYEFSKLVSYCNKRQELDNSDNNDIAQLPTIYCITPTYARPVQEAELTRLSQTLCMIPNAYWIIVEDAQERTDFMIQFLKDTPCSLRYTHLFAVTPRSYKITKGLKWHQRPRGVTQRNEGLKWLRDNLDAERDNGVVFFMDDDNTYSVRLFKEMNRIQKVGVWPVGLVGGLEIEKPLVDPQTGHVMGFNSIWEPRRPFPIDMAGFAINLKMILRQPEAEFSYDAKPGYQETEILKYFTSISELEPLADNCTKIYVWHTRTEHPKLTKTVLKRFSRKA